MHSFVDCMICFVFSSFSCFISGSKRHISCAFVCLLVNSCIMLLKSSLCLFNLVVISSMSLNKSLIMLSEFVTRVFICALAKFREPTILPSSIFCSIIFLFCASSSFSASLIIEIIVFFISSL